MTIFFFPASPRPSRSDDEHTTASTSRSFRHDHLSVHSLTKARKRKIVIVTSRGRLASISPTTTRKKRPTAIAPHCGLGPLSSTATSPASQTPTTTIPTATAHSVVSKTHSASHKTKQNVAGSQPSSATSNRLTVLYVGEVNEETHLSK